MRATGAMFLATIVFAAAALGGQRGAGGTRPAALPEGDRGIAAKYPGDLGIERNPAVLLFEGFEVASVKDVRKRWTEVKNPKGEVLSLSPEVPPASFGRQSLQMTATRGRNTGGHLWKLFKPGLDRMYARFYVRFAEDHPYVHHFVKIGAWRDSPNWPQGEAGYQHKGDRSFQTGIEPGSGGGRHAPPGAWFMYTYWCEMRSWQGPEGTSFYGNAFAPARSAQVPRGKWQCVEFMVKANSAPDLHDGEQAFWVDGKLTGRWAPGIPSGRWTRDKFIAGGGKPFEGFRWRTDNRVKLNTFWLLYYLESVFRENSRLKPRVKTVYNRDVARVWFDHVVVAREYIGPIRAAKSRR